MPQTKTGNQIKQTSLSLLEKEVINGCLIGDGTLSSSGKYYRLRLEHASRHWEYLEWKYKLLKRICSSGAQYVSAHSSMRVGTVGHPEIAKLRQAWYRPYKQIPQDLNLSDLMIAIWFMDDGTKHRDTVDISIHSFSDNSINQLRQQLSSRRIFTTVNHDAKGKRLYVLKESYQRFKELVKPYIVECMAYKLP